MESELSHSLKERFSLANKNTLWLSYIEVRRLKYSVSGILGGRNDASMWEGQGHIIDGAAVLC